MKVAIGSFDKDGHLKKSMMMDARWAESIEKLTKGKFRRLSVEETPRRRRRKTKGE
jgi:hypothetical protein